MPPRKNKGPASDALSELKPGDLVWGKVAGYPWWPGQMMPEDLADEHILRRKKPGTLLVAFFGDKSFGAWHGSCERTGVCPACMAWRVVALYDGRARCCDSGGGSQQGKGRVSWEPGHLCEYTSSVNTRAHVLAVASSCAAHTLLPG